MAPPAILNKIKLLLKLTESPNPNEAGTAQALADALIDKHGLTPEELEALKDPKPLYGEDEKLFFTYAVVGWMQQLALSIATYFDALIIQERQVPSEGAEQHHYYVYGDPEDVWKVKQAFSAFTSKIHEYMDTYCAGREPNYLASYGEGMVDSIKENIYLNGITLPDRQKLTPTDKPVIKDGKMVNTKKEKVRPTDTSIDVNTQSEVKDIGAYFAGVYDGKGLSLVDILYFATEADKPEQLS